MDLVFLDKPLTLEECQQLFRSHNDEAYSVALERMQRLSILMVRDETYMYMNEVFRRGIIGAMTGSGDVSSFGKLCELSPENIVSTEFLDGYARAQWETILYFMVGSEQTTAPRKTVLFLLQRTGLMQRDATDNDSLNITSLGFQFLLQDVNSQLWALLLHYLSMAEAVSYYTSPSPRD